MADLAASESVGVWIFGARGSVALHAMVGARLAGREGFEDKLGGMVTNVGGLAQVDLVDLPNLVFGGHEIRPGGALDEANALAQGGTGLSPSLVATVADDLQAMDTDVRPGCAAGLGPWRDALEGAPVASADARAEVERMRGDIEDFRARHELRTVVALHLGSTEPPVDQRWYEETDLQQLLVSAGDELPPGVLFAAAAIQAGCPFVNFTPSAAMDLPALRNAAIDRALPYAGKDGKTGETLLKSVLAPMFLQRDLRVLSWQSYNMLGNRDGRVLDQPSNRDAKIAGKADLLRGVFDYDLHSGVRIDYVPSLDDWKTAWNLVHFEGFLGTRMTLQFTWQGCDSALAAPLVLDLVRLLHLAHRRKMVGAVAPLAAFFKSPYEGPPADFAQQMSALTNWVVG